MHACQTKLDMHAFFGYNGYEKYDLYFRGNYSMNGLDGRAAWTATVGAKGQIVIPLEARVMFDIQPGDTLILLGDPARGIAIPPKSTFQKWSEAVFGEERKP